MTVYAGETVLIKVDATDFDGETVLDDTVLDEVLLTVFDSDGEEAVAETNMLWESEESAWVYAWHTTTADPGNYRARAKAVGLGETVSLEYKRFRLSRRPVGD